MLFGIGDGLSDYVRVHDVHDHDDDDYDVRFHLAYVVEVVGVPCEGTFGLGWDRTGRTSSWQTRST